MTKKTVAIGDKWARQIAKAFIEWAETVKLDKQGMPLTPFDPSPFIEAAFVEGGEAQLAEIGKLVGMGVSLDLKNPEAVAWLEKFGAKEIKLVDAGTKAAIKDVIRQGFEEGLSPAKQTAAIKEMIGLHPRQLNALRNFEAGLGDVSETVRQKTVDKYAGQLLRRRAETIALSESHQAANFGHAEATRGAVERGILDPDKYEEVRIVAWDDRLCDICQGAAGETREIPDGTFPTTGTTTAWTHPRCRCTSGLREKRGRR